MKLDELVNNYNSKSIMLGVRPKIILIEDKAFYNIRLATSEIINIPDFVHGIYGDLSDYETVLRIMDSRINCKSFRTDFGLDMELSFFNLQSMKFRNYSTKKNNIWR